MPLILQVQGASSSERDVASVSAPGFDPDGAGYSLVFPRKKYQTLNLVSIYRPKQAQRTDDARLLWLLLLLHLAETIVCAQVDDQGGQLLVVDAAAQLAVECVSGRLLKRIFVDLFE